MSLLPIAAFSGSAYAQAVTAPLSTTPLIERAKFFGNPARVGLFLLDDHAERTIAQTQLLFVLGVAQEMTVKALRARWLLDLLHVLPLSRQLNAP